MGRRLGHVIPAIERAVAQAREAGVPVVFVQHNGPPGNVLAPGSEGWEIHPVLTPREDDVVIQKTWSDSFADSGLQQALDGLGVDRLVVTGAQSEMCVDATIRRAATLGYDVTLVADAHTTFDNGTLRRAQIVAHHNETLANLSIVGATIDLATSEDSLFEPSDLAKRGTAP